MMASPEEKSSNRTPIMVSIQLHGKLNTIRQQLQKVIGKNISLEKALEIVITAKSLDVILTDLILEYYPTELKEPSNKEKRLNRLETWFIDIITEIAYPSNPSEKLIEKIHEKFKMERIL